MARNAIRDAALSYAERGWLVNPLRPGSKALAFGGEDVLALASRDPAQIEAWWREDARRNVGLVPGPQSGLVVLDIDVKNGARGLEALAALESTYGPLPPTRREATPSGGEHIFFKHPGIALRNRKGGGQLAGIEFFGAPYNVAVAPSVVDGKRYRCTQEVELAELPGSLLAQLQSAPQAIAEGSRNDAIFREAARLRERDVPEFEAWALLQEFNATRCTPPLAERELRQCFKSAWKYAPGFAPTDLGNAKRIVARYGVDLRFVHDFDRFLIWRGPHWATDRDDEIERWTKDMVRAIYDEARDESDDDRRKRLTQWALASQSVTRIRAARDLTRSEPGIPIAPQALDADPMLLGVANGTLDLTTGELREARRDDYITKIAPIAYDPQAEAPLWRAFLDKCMGGDAQLVEFLQRASGYCLTGRTDEQCLFLLYGSGLNGKTTFLNIVRALLGDYATVTDVQTWMTRERGGVTNDIAALRGVRLVVSSEVEDGARFAEVLIKLVTGSDVLKARFLYAEFFEFRPALKLWIAANHKPQIRGDDLAIWRRIRLIPFAVTIAPEERDLRLEAKLREELPGILRWAVEGCLSWQRDGLPVPDAVRAATNEYRREMDHFGQFLAERCEIARGRTARAGQVFATYRLWAESQGIDFPMTMQRMWSKLSERGMRKVNTMHGVVYQGIGLRETDPAHELEEGVSGPAGRRAKGRRP